MAPPVVTLRLPLELLARLTAAADAHGLPLERYCTHALADYLRLQASRTTGARNLNDRLSADERRASALRAVQARWAKRPREV